MSFFMKKLALSVSTRFPFQFPISQVKRSVNLAHSVFSTLLATRQCRAVPLSLA